MRLDSLMQDLAIQAQQHAASSSRPTEPADAFYEHSSATRISTEAYINQVLRTAYPNQHVSIVPSAPSGTFANLLRYADATGLASYQAIVDANNPLSEPLVQKTYLPPPRRIDGTAGEVVADAVKFGKFKYVHEGVEFILFLVDSRDGVMNYPTYTSQFLIHPPTAQAEAQLVKLVRAVGRWTTELHDQIWVFDQGYWAKDSNLWKSVQKSQWQDVILDDEKKTAIQNDVRHFFDSRERYTRLRVPWKRGVIYYGPPGNGKTISIKAISHELYTRKEPVPTLYVKTFAAFGGPQRGIKMIFDKARTEAPCLLVFEDLDSLVDDSVRSYFLNEVDGLTTNEGVLMIGSTNHLERLDPGISKRPSRFDRKFEFPKPNLEQRTMYCEYWRGKLADNRDVEFPKELSPEIAKITDKFSFAYLQEAFVASLLAIAFREEGDEGAPGWQRRSWEDLILWKEIRKQVEILREEL